MRKTSFWIYALIIVLLVIIIGSIIFLIINNILQKSSTGQVVKEVDNSSITGQAVNEGVVEESNFSSDKIHFRTMPIKYYIYSPLDNDSENNYTNCSEIKYYNIHKAFDTIQNDTNGTVNFREVSFEEKSANLSIIEDNTITIICNKYKTNGGYIVEGEAGPVMDPQDSYIIKTGVVYLYFNGLDTKGDASGEIHEILHVFGYQHVTDRASIMNPVSRYVMKIDKEIVDDLVKTYS